ncbi:MAG: hypothetical protein NT141_02025 [candidate division WWE3 bacterium]|nr:hypothetical protein [candidate division WWE3 bacterium]
MFVWLGSAFITAYLPSNTQKAQIKSLGLVLVVMAGAAFANIISSKLTKINWKILSPILLIFLGGYFINTTFPIYRILNQKTPDKISYISKNRLMALDWLDKHENNKSRTVLSTEKEMGSYVPLITNLTTLNSYALFESAEIIKDNSKVIPDYVIEISGGNIIKSTEYGAVYQNPEVTIYENTKI